MQSKLFTDEFLNRLQEIQAAQESLELYTNVQGLSFHDAIIEIAKDNHLTPEYIYDGYKAPIEDQERIKKFLKECWDDFENV
jgi:hypothetical protein